MQIATRKSESAAPEPAGRQPAAAKRAKLPAILVTRDDMLWPQICTHIGPGLLLKQVDSVDELVAATPAGQPGIILWDARKHGDATHSAHAADAADAADAASAAVLLSRMQLHSPRFAVVALDDAGNAAAWARALGLRQIIAQVALPVPAEELKAALDIAHDEVNARVALHGDGADAAAPATGAGGKGPGGAETARRIAWIPAVLVGVALAGAVGFMALRRGDAPLRGDAPVRSGASVRVAASVQSSPATSSKAANIDAAQPAAAVEERTEDKVDALIEKAQQAMLDRHFIDPADGSALTLYRNALLLDANNGEAQQGLQRLAEVLFARVQSALDERKIDVALQALETARSINATDDRLAALDERISAMRAELGPAQILAAINAQNFDRAAQLIDDAARGKSLNNAKLAQLREELRRRQDETEIANWMKLIDTRLSQDRLVDPRNDSAAYYLSQARAAGASPAAVQVQSLELNRRLAAVLHSAIDQRRFADGERLIVDARSAGVPATAVAALQHDLILARGTQTSAAPEAVQNVDPRAVQAQVIQQAGAALDSGQQGRAESLLQTAAALGASADLSPLQERLTQMKLAGADAPLVAEASLTRVKGIELDYPAEALRKNIEGWVELSFVVTAEGKVTKIAVLNSSPAGIFDAAAAKAMSRARYKPMLQDGKPLVVASKLRIAFRLSK